MVLTLIARLSLEPQNSPVAVLTAPSVPQCPPTLMSLVLGETSLQENGTCGKTKVDDGYLFLLLFHSPDASNFLFSFELALYLQSIQNHLSREFKHGMQDTAAVTERQASPGRGLGNSIRPIALSLLSSSSSNISPSFAHREAT